MLFGYSLHAYMETQNSDVNKTQYGSRHFSSVLWDVCGS